MGILAHPATLQKRTLDHQIYPDHMGKTRPDPSKHLNILRGDRDTPRESHSGGYTYTQEIETVPPIHLDPHRSLDIPGQGERNSQ